MRKFVGATGGCTVTRMLLVWVAIWVPPGPVAVSVTV